MTSRTISRASLALVLVACCAPLAAVELTATSISMPEYDDAGHLIRWLRAESGSGSVERPVLRHGSLEFFAVGNEAVPTGRLEFDDAVFLRASQQISGEGRVIYRSPDGQIEGAGFIYDIPSAHLQLRSSMVLMAAKGTAVSQSGEVTMAQVQGQRVAGIAEARLKGAVQFTKAPGVKLEFDRAETASAIYTGADGVLSLASPITTWTGEKKAVAGFGEMRIPVGKLPKEASGPTPVSDKVPAK